MISLIQRSVHFNTIIDCNSARGRERGSKCEIKRYRHAIRQRQAVRQADRPDIQRERQKETQREENEEIDGQIARQASGATE